MIRRKAYKRVENVLIRDKFGTREDSLMLLENDIKTALQNYMKVSDMHIYLKKARDGKYTLRIDGIVSNISSINII